MVAYKQQLVCTEFSCVIADPRVSQLSSQAAAKINTALRPRTSQGYTAKIKTFLAFLLTYNLSPTDLDVILAFLELLAQSGSRAHTLATYISALRHYFQLWDWDCKSLSHRKTHLFIKAVLCNAKYIPKFKATPSVISLSWLLHVTTLNMVQSTKLHSCSRSTRSSGSPMWPRLLPELLT